jgi:hypothetical protein
MVAGRALSLDLHLSFATSRHGVSLPFGGHDYALNDLRVNELGHEYRLGLELELAPGLPQKFELQSPQLRPQLVPDAVLCRLGASAFPVSYARHRYTSPSCKLALKTLKE